MFLPNIIVKWTVGIKKSIQAIRSQQNKEKCVLNKIQRQGKGKRSLEVGRLGEEVVADWLQSRNWEILHYRWYCRWGEIDLVARSPEPMLLFVEVKTRSSGNWDVNGLLAVNPQKRAKLWQTAELFLAKYPALAELPCRFDLALVRYKRILDSVAASSPIILQQPVSRSGYEFVLQDYLEGVDLEG
ncbi:MAG: YraN family protein [Cyanobacteria bacterium SBLK]|nr:YraN family protein [Cyanobacteria bacterium SBLK]